MRSAGPMLASLIAAMGRRVLPGLLALVVAAVSLVAPTAARADGDPASDVLLSQPAFIPADADIPAKQSDSLTGLLGAAQKAGFPIRVAVIPDPYDLGYVTQLWQRPSAYAEFLGIELSLVYKGPLLVVMPNGFGYHWAGHPTTSANAALSRIAISAGGPALAGAAREAVRRIAGASGVALSPATDGGSGASSIGVLPFVILVLAVVAVAVLLVRGLDIRRRRTGDESVPNESPAAPAAGPAVAGPRPHSAMPRWLRFALPALALFAAADLALLVLALSAAHRAPRVLSGAADSASSVPPIEAAPISWAEGHQAAPNFALTDQNGRPVSLGAYRGRPVIVTFIDPLCRELCPLAAQVLTKVDDQLPPAERPEILAVSVNVYGNARANLLQDFSKWSLTPNWRWAVGSPKQLAKVWKSYYAEVDVTTKRIAGTTVHYLAHSEIAYLVDPKGYERELFAWPYGARRVEDAVRNL